MRELDAGAAPIVTSTGELLILFIDILSPVLFSATATSLVLPSPPIETVKPELGTQFHPLSTPLAKPARTSLKALADVLPPYAALVPIALLGFVAII
jgi:hypothetical protein